MQRMKKINGLDLMAKAPLAVATCIQLDHDAKHIVACAARKCVTLDSWEVRKEERMAETHFALGCWLYHFTTLRGLGTAQYLQARVEILVRLFMADIQNPGYSFFTVFDFGERQFDSIFEEGDGDAVLDALRVYLKHDKTGLIRKAFDRYGWATTTKDKTHEQANLCF